MKWPLFLLLSLFLWVTAIPAQAQQLFTINTGIVVDYPDGSWAIEPYPAGHLLELGDRFVFFVYPPGITDTLTLHFDQRSPYISGSGWCYNTDAATDPVLQICPPGGPDVVHFVLEYHGTLNNTPVELSATYAGETKRVFLPVAGPEKQYLALIRR